MTGDKPDSSPLFGGRVIHLGDVEIDIERQTILRAGTPVLVEPKVFAVALELLRQRDRLVTRDELLDAVWGHRHVTPGVLTRAIAQLRQAMGDDPHRPRYIETRHGVGYRFIGVAAADPAADTSMNVADAGAGPATAPPEAGMSGPAAEAAPPDVDPANESPWRLRNWALASAIALAVAAAAWWSSPRAPVSAPVAASVAVLPFQASAGGDDDFAAGLSMELRDALAGVPELQVAAATALAGPGRPVADARTLGNALGVAYVLDGTVGREAGRIRIHVRLVDTGTGYIAWNRRYDRALSALFDTQAEIAGEVAGRLLGALPAVEADQLGRRLAPTADVAAFDAYVHALRQVTDTLDADAASRAEAGFTRALALDAGFARAQAGLCRVELWRFATHQQPAAFDNARTACQRAARMDPTEGQVQVALGDLYRTAGDPDTAADHYRAVEHDPAWRGEALAGLAKVRLARGDAAGALDMLEAAAAAAPTDVDLQAEFGYHAYLVGHLETAVATYRKVVTLDPFRASHWDTYGALLLAAGDRDAAAVALERGVAIEPSETALSNLGTLKYQAGDYAGASAQFRRALSLSDTAHHRVWGNLGDALLADPATRSRAPQAFGKAAELAARQLSADPNDPQTTAALGWYLVNTGEAAQARRLAERATLLAREQADIGEVALSNADTYAALGEPALARARIAVAREAGIDEARVSTDDVLRRAGLVGSSDARSSATNRE